MPHSITMIGVRSQKTRRRLTIQRFFILVKLCRESSSFCKKLTLHVNVGHTGQPSCKTFNSQSPRTSSFQSKFSCSDDKRDISYWLVCFSFSPSLSPINVFFWELPELPLPPLPPIWAMRDIFPKVMSYCMFILLEHNQISQK